MTIPDTRYVKTADGVHIAYQVLGDGPVDIVYEPGWASNVDLVWDRPDIGRFLRRVATWARLIVFDRRGSGLSDRTAGIPSLETRMDDLRAVMDACGSGSAVVVGLWDGGNTAALFASMYPQRALGIVLIDTRARNLFAPDYPWGDSSEEEDAFMVQADAGWGTGRFERWWLSDSPGGEVDAEYLAELARYFRHCISPGGAVIAGEMWNQIDIRDALPTIQVPTLVIDGHPDPAHGRYLAEHIAGARLVHSGQVGRPSPYHPGPGSEREADEIRAFVDSIEAERASFDRVLATVMFTDIVGSSEKAAELGDTEWAMLLERHHRLVRAMLARYRGVEVDTAGDGFFATFDGPARAVRCGQGIVDAMTPLGIEVRVGVHTGEVQTIAGKVGGIGVVIGARVGAKARGSQVLVSQTVKDLSLGSGLLFEDAGEHDLKGVPDRWHLYGVTNDPA